MKLTVAAPSPWLSQCNVVKWKRKDSLCMAMVVVLHQFIISLCSQKDLILNRSEAAVVNNECETSQSAMCAIPRW